MNINCDTPIENLLNLKAVKELANEYYNTIKKAIDELTSIISNEQNKGLSKEAFNINGDNMIYEKANAININLSIILLVAEVQKNNIIKTATEKSGEELNTLKKAVYNKLIELSSEISSLNMKKIVNNNQNIVTELNQITEIYKKYKKKYDQLLIMKE